MTQKESDEFDSQIDKALQTLGEHYDSVQIFVTRKNDGMDSIKYCAKGVGNYFTRFGHVQQWLTAENEHVRCEARVDHVNRDNE